MKICIYQNDIYNYETVGYILEYCSYYNFKVHIYSNFWNDKSLCSSYYRWYKKFFTELNFLILNERPDNVYDVIFYLKDKNKSYFIPDNELRNTISIEHYGFADMNDISVCKLGTRKFIDRSEIPFAYPFYNIISKYNKIELIKNHTRLRVLFVGKFNIPTSLTFSYFDNFENIDFYIIRTEKDENYFEYLEKTSNMYFFEEVDCESLINFMSEAHYIFFNDSVIHEYYAHVFNETLHLAFSCLTRCIIPETWNKYLNFNSVLIYNDTQFLSPNGQLKISIEDFNSYLPFIQEERQYYISARNIILDKIIKSITNIEPVIDNCKSWFSKTLDILSVKKPNIFVETGTYLENNILSIYSEFREIHSIDIKNEFIDSFEYIFKDSNKVFLYEGSSSSVFPKLSKNIEEPAIFYFDVNLFEISGDNRCPMIRELEILNNRNYNDVIVIDNIRSLDEKEINGVENEYSPTGFDFNHVTVEDIMSVYTRPSGYYNSMYGMDNRLIIIPN